MSLTYLYKISLDVQQTPTELNPYIPEDFSNFLDMDGETDSEVYTVIKGTPLLLTPGLTKTINFSDSGVNDIRSLIFKANHPITTVIGNNSITGTTGFIDNREVEALNTTDLIMTVTPIEITENTYFSYILIGISNENA